MANVLTQVGEEFIVDLIDGAASNDADHVGWGTGAGTAAKGDTDLFTAAIEARVSATRSQPAADKVRWFATLTANAAKVITNVGVFAGAGTGSPPTGGTPLIVKSDFASWPGGVSVSLQSGDKIEFTIDLEIT